MNLSSLSLVIILVYVSLYKTAQAAPTPPSASNINALAPATAYPTTVTSIWSTTETSASQPGPWGAVYMIYMTTLRTVTLLEPYPAQIQTYPATVVQTAVSKETHTTRITYSSANGPVSTTIDSRTVSVPSTWVLHQAQPTDLAAGTTPAGLPCEECAPASWQADSRCAGNGLQTACQRQCDLRDGVWWCYRMYYSDYGTGVQMGRACWGNGSYFEQLVEPCVAGDHRLSCVSCKGLDSSWDAVNWI